MRTALLDNIVWNSLAGHHAANSSGSDRIRRYARGFPPLVGAADVKLPDLAELVPYCDCGEQLYCAGWSGRVPEDWTLHVDSVMEQYVWDKSEPAPETLDAIRIGPEHVEQAIALVELTRPGPFGVRNYELGEYYGAFENGRLVAMAGERMHAGVLREISGVCTHPDARGRSLARQLMTRLIRAQLRRGQVPFLHVMSANQAARALYEKMGFRHHQQIAVRVISRQPLPAEKT